MARLRAVGSRLHAPLARFEVDSDVVTGEGGLRGPPHGQSVRERSSHGSAIAERSRLRHSHAVSPVPLDDDRVAPQEVGLDAQELHAPPDGLWQWPKLADEEGVGLSHEQLRKAPPQPDNTGWLDVHDEDAELDARAIRLQTLGDSRPAPIVPDVVGDEVSVGALPAHRMRIPRYRGCEPSMTPSTILAWTSIARRQETS